MPDCTVEQVYEHARFRLNDLFRDGGETFTDDRLRRAFVQAWEELMQEMAGNQVPAVEKVCYLTLPAYTSELHLELFGLSDAGEIQSVEERPAPALRAVTGASTASPIQLTVSTTGLANNQAVIVSGILGQVGANGRFFITVNDATHATLRGSRSAGDYVSGGSLTLDQGSWDPVEERDELPAGDPSDQVRVFALNSGRFEFIGCTQDVQLRIRYLASGAAPETGYVGVDMGLNFLSSRTASLAALPDQQFRQGGMMLAQEAIAHLNSLVSGLVRERQRAPRQRGMYGSRRATVGFPYVRVT